MAKKTLAEQYNYDEFVPEKFERWLRFEDSPALGKPVPDFALFNLDQTPTSLSSELSKFAYTIVEFGSFT